MDAHTMLRKHAYAYQRQPRYEKKHLTPANYLLLQRVKLLRELPADHRLRQRADRRTGSLQKQGPPNLRRDVFSDEQLRDMKRRRRATSTTSDYDNANSHLQRSQLVTMWNAEYEKEEQWREYDQAQRTMEERRSNSGLPEGVVDSEQDVAERWKKIVLAGWMNSSDKKLPEHSYGLDDELEEGEIEEYEEVMQSIEKENVRLRAENESLKAIFHDSFPPRPPSPPMSNTSEDETDGSSHEN